MAAPAIPIYPGTPRRVYVCHGKHLDQRRNRHGQHAFFGTSTVTTVASGATFTDGKALFELVADGEGKVRILMHETRFAAEMPALEMEVPGISYTGEEKTIDLSAASVTPEIKGTPFAKYVITNLTGEAARTELTVTFTCAGAFDVSYQGRLIIEK